MTHCIHSLKKAKKLLLFLFFVITLVSVLRYISFSASAAPADESLPYKGYVVTLKHDPLATYLKQDLKNEPTSVNTRAKITDYRKTLEAEHASTKENIETILHKKISDKLSLLGEYKNTINAIALDVNDDEAEKIKKESPFVKDVYKNLQVNATLSQSVPMIHADKVWDMKDNQTNSVTGKGVNIAVLDTGADYTHADLGKTVIEERPLEKITTAQLDPIWLGRDQVFGYSGNILAYPLENKIALYSFLTKQTTMVDLATPSLTIIGKVVLHNNNLVYFASDMYSQQGIYLYNTQTKKTKQIANTHEIHNFYISDGKIVYGRTANKTNKGGIYLYDIQKGKETLIEETGDITPNPLISGNMIATAIVRDSCYININLYNIITKKTKVLTPPSLGNLLDFQGNKILYDATPCGAEKLGQAYNVFDVTNGTSIRIDLGKGISPTQYTVIAGNIIKGSLDKGMVYVEKVIAQSDLNRIMAYNTKKKELKQINVLKNSYYFKSQNNRVCFLSDDLHIYCHTYNLSYDYPLPKNIFNDKVIGGYDFINNDSDPMDDNGHGTHVADIVGGNGTVKGVAPGANIIAYKVLNEYGQGYLSTVLQGIDTAVQTRSDEDSTNDIGVINLSLGADCKGTYTKNCGPDDILSQAVDLATDAGISVVVAAGNTGSSSSSSSSSSTINSPGTARKAITVGAVSKDYYIPTFSSRGPVIYNNETIDKPDVVAPGVGICASEWNIFAQERRCGDDTHIAIDGTSMASPHVAGTIALYRQLYSTATPEQIKMALIQTASNLNTVVPQGGGGRSYDKYTQGAGLIDALKFVSPSPTPTNTPTPTESPTPTPSSPTP